MGGAAERGDRAGADALVDVLGGKGAERRHEALREHQHRGAAADPVGERADRGGKRRGGDREADEVEAGDLDVGGALDGDRVESEMPGR